MQDTHENEHLLDCLGVRDEEPIVVEHTIGLGQRGALGEVDADTLFLNDGGSGCDERESDGEKAGLAEHGDKSTRAWGEEPERLRRLARLARMDRSEPGEELSWFMHDLYSFQDGGGLRDRLADRMYTWQNNCELGVAPYGDDRRSRDVYQLN